MTPLTRALNSMLTALNSLSVSLSGFESLLNLICKWKIFSMSKIAVGNYDRDCLKVGTSRKYVNVTIDMINIFDIFVKRARKRKRSKKRVCFETNFACLSA